MDILKESVHNPETIVSMGMASVPQDRLRQGLIEEFTVQENLILGLHDGPPYSRGGSLKWKAIREFAKHAIQEFEIKTTGPLQPVGQLSGGNLQKVILAREVSRPIKVMVASSPSRGLDIGATYYVYSRFLELLQTGAGILMISEDLDEIFNVSDRIAVIYNGRIMGVFDVNDIGHLSLMTGMLPVSAGLDRQCPGSEELKAAAIVNWMGITDVPDVLEGPNQKTYAVQWLGSQPDREAIARRVSPINYVRPGLPPILTVHGDAVLTVPYNQAVGLHQALDRAGVPNRLLTVAGEGHWRSSAEQDARLFGQIREFLAEHGLARVPR